MQQHEEQYSQLQQHSHISTDSGRPPRRDAQEASATAAARVASLSAQLALMKRQVAALQHVRNQRLLLEHRCTAALLTPTFHALVIPPYRWRK